MKHAYLIIAHDSFELLQELLFALDDSRNDIYVHVDKKANLAVDKFTTTKSQLYILSERLDARWGDYSLVNVELLLFGQAYDNGPYDYYHLLSGVDFPIKSQDYIHDFFSKHPNKEFVGFAKHTNPREIWWRSQHYFVFSRDFRSNNILKKIVRAVYARLQSLFRYRRTSMEVKKGCQWCSITHALVGYLLERKELIRKTFNHTYCPDEMFIQTLCWNSEFRDRIYDINDEFNGCKRFILWHQSIIQNLDDIELNTLLQSDRLFARKFSSKGLNLIKMISHNCI